MDFSPRDYEQRYKTIKEVKSSVNDVADVNFSDCVDSFASDIESIARGLDDDGGIGDYVSRHSSGIAKDIESKISEIKNAVSEINNVESEFVQSFREDFSDKLRFYTEFVEFGVPHEDIGDFPFKEWVKEIDRFMNGYQFSASEVYFQIERMLKINKEIAISNIAEHLSSVLVFKKPTEVLSQGHIFFEENMSENFANVLCGKDAGDFIRVLNGEKVELSLDSKLFFKYAAYLPSISWNFKEEEINGNIVKVCSSDWEEIFDHFSKTEIWEKIKSSIDFEKKFIDELLDYSDGSNKIYNISFSFSNRSYPRVDKVYWDRAKAFAKCVLKDDLEATDYFVNKISADFPKDDPDINSNLTQIMNMALHAKLQEEVPNKNQIKEKKLKV